MRLGWDKKDWDSLTFTLEKDGKTATGRAVSTVAVGETHTYSVRLTKISTSKPVEDNWKLFNGAGFSVVMPTNVEKRYVEMPTSGGISPTNISSVVEENLSYQIMDGPNAYSLFFKPGESTLQANESLYRKYVINDMQAGLCQPYQQFGCQLVFSNRKVNKGMIELHYRMVSREKDVGAFRFYFTATKQYLVGVVAGSKVNLNKILANKFLNSVKITI